MGGCGLRSTAEASPRAPPLRLLLARAQRADGEGNETETRSRGSTGGGSRGRGEKRREEDQAGRGATERGERSPSKTKEAGPRIRTVA
jgi:hypothetical protein